MGVYMQIRQALHTQLLGVTAQIPQPRLGVLVGVGLGAAGEVFADLQGLSIYPQPVAFLPAYDDRGFPAGIERQG